MFKDSPQGMTHSFPPKGCKIMTGEKYGYLIVTCDWIMPSRKGTTLRWLCKCKCGNELYVSRDHLISGNTKSCGCIFKKKVRNEKK